MPNTPKLIRTELERQIRERNMTYEEFIEYTERFARDHHEPGTLSLRHLQRLAAGYRSQGCRSVNVRPATARLLEHIFGLSIQVLLGAPGLNDEATNLSDEIESASSIDDSATMRLALELSSIREIDRRFGGPVTHDQVVRCIHKVERLRRYAVPAEVRSRLAKLQVEFCTLAGWQAFDMGMNRQAWHFYDQGLAAAWDAGSDHAALARAGQSLLLAEMGRTEESNQLMASIPINRLGSAARAWVLAARGDVLARSSEASASLRAFEAADRELRTGTEGAEIVAFDQTHLDRWRGSAESNLGLTSAVATLGIALTNLDPSFVRARCALRLDLANSLMRGDCLDAAQDEAIVAMGDAKRLGSTRLYRRAREIANRCTAESGAAR